MSAPTLLQRLQAALKVLRCQGHPVVIEKTAVAALAKAAGRVYVSTADESPTNIWACGGRMDRCNGCPRFKAYRQGLAAGEHWARHLAMTSRVDQLEAQVREGDRKGAEIDHVNHDGACAVNADSQGYLHPDSDGVLNPVTPRVVYPQNGAEHGNGQGDVLNALLVHGAAQSAVDHQPGQALQAAAVGAPGAVGGHGSGGQKSADDSHELSPIDPAVFSGKSIVVLPDLAPTVILSAPQGWGKTRNAQALAAEFGCDQVVDDWSPSSLLQPGALHLTHVHPGLIAACHSIEGKSIRLVSRGWEGGAA